MKNLTQLPSVDWNSLGWRPFLKNRWPKKATRRHLIKWSFFASYSFAFTNISSSTKKRSRRRKSFNKQKTLVYDVLLKLLHPSHLSDWFYLVLWCKHATASTLLPSNLRLSTSPCSPVTEPSAHLTYPTVFAFPLILNMFNLLQIHLPTFVRFTANPFPNQLLLACYQLCLLFSCSTFTPTSSSWLICTLLPECLLVNWSFFCPSPWT